MTEDETRKKWCPQRQAPPVIAVGIGVEVDRDILDSNCIASGCACWGWDAVLQNPESQENGLIRPHYEYSKTHGHCGLIKS